MNRPLDLALAGVLLVVTAPLLALAALAIRLESRGPVFYSQRRIGKDGRPVFDPSDTKKIETVPQRVARAALQLDETGVNGSSFHAQTG